MSRSFLFGGNSSIQSQNKYLVEFRAGKMSMKGKMVHPDKRKGLVFIQQTDDSLMHFCWKDRKSGLVEDDLIIFPDDVEFKKVSQCTTGRVFVLKFKSSSRKCFYWMQEPKTDKDDEYCSKVNEYLNNPPPLGSNRNGGSGLGSGSSSQSSSLQSEINNLTDNDIQNLINNMNQQQLMQLLSGVGGIGGVANLSSLLSGSRPSSSQSNVSTTESSSTPEIPVTTTPSVIVTTTSSSSNSASLTTTTAPTTAPTTVTSTESSNQSQIQLSDLQNILSGLNVPASSAEGNSSHTSNLSSALTVEALQPLFDNQELMDRLKSLLPPTSESASGLSESVAVSETLRSTVQSPQFQQALSMFSAALQSGQLGPLMQQFGLPQEVIDAANSGDMEAFVKALQKSKESKEQSDNQCNTSNTKEKKDDDEEMSLD